MKTVGREAEIARLNKTLDAVVGGRGATCLISGEAGAGKSTLTQEFISRALDARGDLVMAIGSCDAQIGISDPYLPFLEVISELTGHVESKLAQGRMSETAAARLRRIAGASADMLLDFAPDLLGTFIPGSSLVARFVKSIAEKSGLQDRLRNMGATSGEMRVDQQQIFDSYTKVLHGLSSKMPVILVLDDLHWADAPSCSLLFHLAQSITDKRLMIIGTYRANDVAFGYNGERHPMTRVINELKRYHGDIIIDLDHNDATRRRAFVRELIDSEPNELGDTFSDELYRHTNGHALFTTEMLRAMQDRDLIVRNDAGVWIAPRAIDWSILPSRVEGVIEERIGRLEDELRDVLRVASVEGEVFTAEIVARIQEVSERSLLNQLSEELVSRHRLVSEGDVERIGRTFLSHYAFTHALFQKYFYDHLGRRERMILHENVAELLEELYAGHLDDVASQLARHYVLSGNAEKAFGHVMAVAKRAMRVSAYQEALAQSDVALDLLPDLRDRDPLDAELDVQLLRGTAFQATLGWTASKTLETLARTQELASKLPPSARTLPMIFRIVAEPLANGKYKEARKVALHINDPALSGTANGRLVQALIRGMTGFWVGELTSSRDASLEGVEWPAGVAEDVDDNTHRVLLLRQLMLDEFLLGNQEASERYRDEAIAIADRFANRFNISIARAAAAWHAWHLRDPHMVLAAAAKAREMGADKFPFYNAQLDVLTAWAEGVTEKVGALERLEAGGAVFRSTGTYWFSIQAAMRAELYLLFAAYGAGLDDVEKSIGIALDIGDNVYLPELYRFRGDLLAVQDRRDDAANSYRGAIDLAREQASVVLEARAATALDLLNSANAFTWRRTLAGLVPLPT